MSLWIFGYGSLIWRPDFPSRPARVASVSGWERRLDQGSPDHRGTPERLGRVATLIQSAGAVCWGAAFEVEDDDAATVLAALDHRERGGYVRLELTAVLRDDGRAVPATTWIAAPENPYYLGPAAVDAMVAQINVAIGPSGHNVEYVIRLAETFRALGVDDPHVFELAAALSL